MVSGIISVTNYWITEFLLKKTAILSSHWPGVELITTASASQIGII